MKIILNPDNILVKDIKRRLLENNGYCPCASIQTEDTKCMCKNFKQQEYEGECHCGLYLKVSE